MFFWLFGNFGVIWLSIYSKFAWRHLWMPLRTNSKIWFNEIIGQNIRPLGDHFLRARLGIELAFNVKKFLRHTGLKSNMIVITHKNFKVGLKRNYTDSYFRIRIRILHINTISYIKIRIKIVFCRTYA